MFPHVSFSSAPPSHPISISLLLIAQRYDEDLGAPAVSAKPKGGSAAGSFRDDASYASYQRDDAAEEAARARRMANFEEQAMIARIRRLQDKLETTMERRAQLEVLMLETTQKMREEKLARKEAEEQYEDMIKHLNDATTNRLKVQEAAQKLEQDVTDIKSLETQINKLRSIELPGLHHDLEKTLGAAREQAEELANFDTMSNSQSRTIEQERLEVMNAYEEELRVLGLQVAKLTEHVTAAGTLSQRDSEVIKGLIYDEAKMLSAAQGDVEMRKGELKQIDAKLMRIMKVLEHTQEANYDLRTALDHTEKILEETKANDEREYKYMHRRLTQPYLREELIHDGSDFQPRTNPLPISKPKKAVLNVSERLRGSRRKPLVDEEEVDAANDEMGTIAGINILDDEEMGRIADSEATVERTLEHELSTMMINPPDPLVNQPKLPPPTGTIAEAMEPNPSEGEVLVSQSLMLLKEMQAKQAATLQKFSKDRLDRYSMSISQLDKQLEQNKRHLSDVENDGDFSNWNEKIPETPEVIKPDSTAAKKEAAQPKLKPGKAAGHFNKESAMELFNRYDTDRSGKINKAEITAIFIDLQLFDTLDDDELIPAIEKAWAEADADGSGEIDYKEFVQFIGKFDHIKPKQAMPANIPKGYDGSEQDIVFQVFKNCWCGSKKNPSKVAMQKTKYLKAMKKMGYVDSTTMNATTHQIQFMRNAVNKKWLEYDGFLRLLAKIASSFQVPFKKVASDFTTRCTINSKMKAAQGGKSKSQAEDEPEDEEEEEEEAGFGIRGDVEDIEPPAAFAAFANEEAADPVDPDEAADPLEPTEPADAAEQAGPGIEMSKKAANLAKLMKKRAKKGHDMKSWDTKDAIDKIGQSAVPKSMVQESGKGMTIKELFKRYDVDNSGGLDQEELKQVMKDLEVMPSGITEEEAAYTLGEYFKLADENSDGIISWEEFALFYRDLQEVKKSDLDHVPVNVPKKYRNSKEFLEVFVKHCSFGAGQKRVEEMTSKSFLKCLNEVDVIDNKQLTEAMVDQVFTKFAKDHPRKRLTYNKFLDALAQICSYKDLDFDDIAGYIHDEGGPKVTGSQGPATMRKTGLPDRSGGSGDDRPKAGTQKLPKKAAPAKEKSRINVLKSGSGKAELTARNVFDKFDDDGQGQIDRVEFKQVCIFLGLDKEEGFDFEEEFDTANKSDTGMISWNEFNVWFNGLKGKAVTKVEKVSPELVNDKEFKALFEEWANFGIPTKRQKKVAEMQSAGMNKLLKNTGLKKPGIEHAWMDNIFKKHAEKPNAKVMKYRPFLDCLAEIAATDKKKLDDFVKAIKEHGSPKAKATEVDHLGRPIR